MNSSLQRSPSTLVSLKGDSLALLSQSPFYRTIPHGNSTLLVRGDLFSGSLKDTGTEPDWTSLRGQFSAILITNKTLFAYRSPFSPHLLFYNKDTFSDQTLSLVDSSLRFSTDYLIRFVADQPSLQFSSPLTPFEGVYRLPPHSSLKWELGKSPVLTSHPFTSLGMNHESASLEASAEIIRSQLQEILMGHLKKNSPVHCELSGGLDSSFIASFLADLSSSPVKAHMFSYRQHPSHAYSEHCAEQVASEKGISLTVLDSAGLSRVELNESTPYQNEPVDFFWQGALFGKLCQKILPDKSLLFTGFGCDQIFMRNHEVVSYLKSKGKLFSASQHVSAIAHSMNRPSLNFLFQFLLTLLPTPALVLLLDKTKHWRINPFKVDELYPKITRFDRVEWLNAAAGDNSPLQLLSLHEEGETQDFRFFESKGVHPSLNYLIAPQYVLGPYLEVKGIEYIHPFCDTRLIELAFSQIPFSLIHDFVNPYKHLLRQAQKGITPEAVRNRRRDEFSFDGYFYETLKHNQSFLEFCLEEAIQDYPDLIHGPSARAALQAMFFGANGNTQNKLLRLFSYLIWKKNMGQYFSEQEEQFQ